MHNLIGIFDVSWILFGVALHLKDEHERIIEEYSDLNQKLQHSLSEHSNLETAIQGLEACAIVSFSLTDRLN